MGKNDAAGDLKRSNTLNRLGATGKILTSRLPSRTQKPPDLCKALAFAGDDT